MLSLGIIFSSNGIGKMIKYALLVFILSGCATDPIPVICPKPPPELLIPMGDPELLDRGV